MAHTAGNVLIVEDDRYIRDLLTTLLSTEGFHAIAAEDGLEALHLLRSVRHRAPAVPCLVLLDLSMPRLSGTEFRRAQLGDPIVAGVPVSRPPADRLPHRGGQNSAERRGSEDQSGRGLLVDEDRCAAAEKTADGDGGKRVDDRAHNRAPRTLVILG
jgi:CheY-like chemotaxis protein